MTLKKLWQMAPRKRTGRLKYDVLAPDDVSISVDWNKFVPGASVFIPCVDVVECGRHMYHVAKKRDWTLDIRVRIEGGRWGIRVWRVT